MSLRTSLYNQHLGLGAKMTDFHGWQMPLYYTSILEEHACVRRSSGIFDISHMGQLRIAGADARDCLNMLMVSDLGKLSAGEACYTMMLHEQAGILDDLIVYCLAEDDFLVIVNCANRKSDEDWIKLHLKGRVSFKNISDGRSIIAIQGSSSCQVMEAVLKSELKSLPRFNIRPVDSIGKDAFIARTGYTGSDGFELFLPDDAAVSLWRDLIARKDEFGLSPVGLGARDTLRLEAGLRLYGTDMNESTTPYNAGLGWTVSIQKNDFIGKEALISQKQKGIDRRLVGFELAGGPVPRGGCELVSDGNKIGSVTSGTFSPMLNKPIGMAYAHESFSKPGASFDVLIRNRRYAATVVKMPFWQNGNITS